MIRSLQGVSGAVPSLQGVFLSRLHAGVSRETFCKSQYLRVPKCSRVSRESFWVGHSSETPGSLGDHTVSPWSLRAFPSLLGVFLAELPSTPESPRSLRESADTPRSLRPFPESPRSLFWEIPASRGTMRRSRLRSGKCPEGSQLFPAGAAGPCNDTGSPRNAMVHSDPVTFPSFRHCLNHSRFSQTRRGPIWPRDAAQGLWNSSTALVGGNDTRNVWIRCRRPVRPRKHLFHGAPNKVKCKLVGVRALRERGRVYPPPPRGRLTLTQNHRGGGPGPS